METMKEDKSEVTKKKKKSNTAGSTEIQKKWKET
jgi:hypothetical protein